MSDCGGSVVKPSPCKNVKISYHYGLNGVDPHAYGGWAGTLAACRNDARDMAGLVGRARFAAHVRLDREATRDGFRGEMAACAAALSAGDSLVVTFSGHGGQVADDAASRSPHPSPLPVGEGAPIARSGVDETVCFFDGEIRDDELRWMLSVFRPGVKVAVFLDSCHSGGMDREELTIDDLRLRVGAKAMPATIAARIARPVRHFVKEEIVVTAEVLLLAACRADETALDGTHNGAFTECVKAAWELNAKAQRAEDAKGKETWEGWFDQTARICRERHPRQHPEARFVGKSRSMWIEPAL